MTVVSGGVMTKFFFETYTKALLDFTRHSFYMDFSLTFTVDSINQDNPNFSGISWEKFLKHEKFQFSSPKLVKYFWYLLLNF